MKGIMMSKISGLVITLNESKNIQACLESLFQVCDEVIVVDSLSTDATTKIALKYGAKVISQKFLGDGPQRNIGLQYCTHDWVLNLDADERLDEDAIEKIKSLNLDDIPYDCFEFKRKNYLHGKWIKVAGWYPDYVRRLFNRKKTEFLPIKTHTKITSKNFLRLNAHIIHYSFENYQDMINIMNKYSTWQAQSYMESNKRVTAFTPFAHGFVSFFKHYVLKRGFMAGIDGFNIALLNALGSYFKYMKAYENKMENKSL